MLDKGKHFLLLTVSTLIMAIGTYFFKFTNNFTFGGITGLAVLIAKTGLMTAGDFNFVASMTLLVIGMIVLGKKFAAKTAYCSILLSVTLSFLERVCPMKAPLTDQPMLELCFAIALPALGSAILFNIGSSSGGTDIIAMILKKYSSFNIGPALMLSDLLITIAGFFIFDIKTGLYSLLGLTIRSFMVDTFIENFNLSKYFNTAAGQLHAVDGVSFTLEEGKTLGIVGESGCGKSTTGRCILKLIEPTSGKIIFQGNDITKLSRKEMRPLRQKMQMVFQDPFSSLDPRETVMQLISEPIIEHKLIKGREAIEERTLELMRTVGLAERYANVYPHELDGGRRQRIGIARALAMNPKIIVCDEPVSALDVSIQAQILNLLKQLQKDLGLTYIFITHDLSVVKYFSDDIAVMYMGTMVEKAPANLLFKNPLHPYTKALLSAIPLPIVGKDKPKRQVIKGEITAPINLPDACRFMKRCDCPVAGVCDKGNPVLREVEPQHFVACSCVK